MDKLKALKERRAKILEDLMAILDNADSEQRDISEDEETRYNELEVELKQVDADIEKEEKKQTRRQNLEARQSQLSLPANQPPRMAATFEPENPDEFRNLGEFFYCVRFNQNDSRLLYDEREQTMGVGAQGGFMVPTEFRPTMFSVTPQEAIFRPRCTVIPAGDIPDTEITAPALDQGAAKNMFGGVEVVWIGEGVTKPETDAAIREINWKPHEVAAHIVVTDKLLRNWTSAAAFLETQLRLATIASEESKFYNGSGTGCPIGILSSPSRVTYNRATANQIAFADVAGMFARLKMGGSPVWIASQTTIPQLLTIQDASGRYIFQASAVPGIPSTLLGIPMLFHDGSVALGTTGDLVLCDLQYYVIKDGAGPFVAASEHVHFTANKTVIKIFWNVDGKSWLKEPLPLPGSTTNTVSPFIVLN